MLESHLKLRKAGELDVDLGRSYADDVVLLSGGEGVHHGKDGVRLLAGVLRSSLPEGQYTYREVIVEGDYGMLLWTGRSDEVEVHDGADSYVVRDGQIVAQTIHYATRSAQR